MEKKNVGDNPPCTSCEAKGAVLCETCAGSGLYVDSILESQGIIVKVRCLGKQDRKYFVHQLCSCHIGNACSDILSYCRLRRNWKHYVLKMRRPRPHMNSTSILAKWQCDIRWDFCSWWQNRVLPIRLRSCSKCVLHLHDSVLRVAAFYMEACLRSCWTNPLFFFACLKFRYDGVS